MRKRNAREMMIKRTPSDMPTIKCMEKPVIRPIMDDTMTITDISRGDNFIVGKSKISHRINRKKFIFQDLPVNWAKLCISSRKT
jgi:hypothetical protein